MVAAHNRMDRCVCFGVETKTLWLDLCVNLTTDLVLANLTSKLPRFRLLIILGIDPFNRPTGRYYVLCVIQLLLLSSFSPA